MATPEEQLEKTELRLVQLAEEIYGQTPDRILIRPNGKVEVNAQVFLRDAKYPEIQFIRRRPVRKS